MRRPGTADLVETIADLIQNGILNDNEVNKILIDENLSFRFDINETYDEGDVRVHVSGIDEIEVTEDEDEHPNIRILVSRMDSALERGDPGGVLHASASIFETLAKDVINIESIGNQTLASFFERYRRDSELPDPILDYILGIYKRRSTEALAGHGSREPTRISNQDAIILAEMTKAFVRIERQLAFSSIILEGTEVSETNN